MVRCNRQPSAPPYSTQIYLLYTPPDSTSYQVSDPCGRAFDSPQRSSGTRAREVFDKAEHPAGVRFSLRAREIPISEIVQAGQDEVDAGAGAVAVTVTPEELAQARVIGQVRRAGAVVDFRL